ncbi:MAG: hypothetical protein MJZ20_00295 [Bacteroidaceae bacterium]|nr:hypothetical protein [Bacteroidaceae bacterium]
MNIENLKETRIVSKGGHFLPLVFVDMSIPAAYVAAGATYAGREIQKEWNNRKINYSPIPLLASYCEIKINTEEKEHLLNSINDILF